jgi:hypothetical protein
MDLDAFHADSRAQTWRPIWKIIKESTLHKILIGDFPRIRPATSLALIQFVSNLLSLLQFFFFLVRLVLVLVLVITVFKISSVELIKEFHVVCCVGLAS